MGFSLAEIGIIELLILRKKAEIFCLLLFQDERLFIFYYFIFIYSRIQKKWK